MFPQTIKSFLRNWLNLICCCWFWVNGLNLAAKPQCKQTHFLVKHFLVCSTPLQDYRTALKKKKLKPAEEQNTSPGKTVCSHISSDHQGRKKAGPSLSRASFSPDFHLMFFCYFNFTTSKWGENRLIVSMSLDCDQRHTKQFQNFQQPQLWGEDGDGYTNSSSDGFQRQENQTSPEMPG